MSNTRPDLKALEEIECDCVPGLVKVLRTEGIEGVRYACRTRPAGMNTVTHAYGGAGLRRNRSKKGGRCG